MRRVAPTGSEPVMIIAAPAMNTAPPTRIGASGRMTPEACTTSRSTRWRRRANS